MSTEGRHSPHPAIYRVVLIGNAEVGKTSIAQRLIKKEFTENYTETVGAAFFTYQTDFQDKSVWLQIWDTAGQEKYQSLGPIYYRNSAAAIAVYDVTNEESFRALQDWIKAFEANAFPGAKVFIVGNKIDLLEKATVDPIVAQDFAKTHKFEFFKVSAKTGEDVERLFQTLAKELLSAGSSITIKEQKCQEEEVHETKGCC